MRTNRYLQFIKTALPKRKNTVSNQQQSAMTLAGTLYETPHRLMPTSARASPSPLSIQGCSFDINRRSGEMQSFGAENPENRQSLSAIAKPHFSRTPFTFPRFSTRTADLQPHSWVGLASIAPVNWIKRQFPRLAYFAS
jgi:hypothetical protein